MNHHPKTPYSVILKPIGPLCNLGCNYCFYLEKKRLFQNHEVFRISPKVLETFIKQYIESQEIPEVTFAWQGGEPTLLGVEFFRQAVGMQKKFANGRKVTNTIQTNGILLDDKWCEFLAGHNFLVKLAPSHKHSPFSKSGTDDKEEGRIR